MNAGAGARANRFTTLRVGDGSVSGSPFQVRLLEEMRAGGFYVRFPGGLSERHPTLSMAIEAAERKLSFSWRTDLAPRAEEKACPICGGPMHVWKRYPREVCAVCALETVDSDGHPVALYNESLLGTGFVMVREDGTKVEGSRCFIREIACVGAEAYFGGIVVQTESPEKAEGLL